MDSPQTSPDRLNHLLIDLLPLLPGGANGGAKPFVLDLLAELSHRHPTVLMTACCAPAARAELEALSLPNLQLLTQKPGYAGERWLGSRRLARVRRRLGRSIQSEHPPAQLLFCPFGITRLARPQLPLVSILYDLQMLAYPEFFSPADRRERLRNFRRQARRSTRIAAISEYTRSTAIAAGVAAERIRSIPIQIRRPQNEDLAATPLPQGLEHGRYFLYPANLWPHKNHELLLAAFAMAKHGDLPDDIQLVCTGEDLNRRHRLEAVAEGLRISRSVKMTGFIAAEQRDSLYTHSLAVVFPSLYEGFGMPVIEAMALGVPVACSRSTALAEVAGEAALLFDPGHPGEIAASMCRLSLENGLRETCIQKGSVQSLKYTSPGRMANSYWELFHDALKDFPAS